MIPLSETSERRFPWRKLITIAIPIVLATLFGLGAFFFTRTIASSQGLPLLGGFIGQEAQATEEAGIPGVPEIPAAAAVEMPVVVNPWDGKGRVTVLLVGLDFRDWDAGEKYARSDTMILLTMDPEAKTAGILSIPRDLWTAIPGFQHGKINTAYYLGDAYQLPGGGPALAVETVEQLIGVPINYYAQIDFAAFTRFIDEIGGVKIDVPAPITVDLLGGGSKTKKKLQAGVQVLPGEWALAYARARNTENGDFDRARRQQQVIMAVRNRLLSADMLPRLIQNDPQLYNELATGIRTNLSLDEVIQLALLAQQVPEEKITRGVIGEEHTIFGWSPDNLSILIPLPDKIQELISQIFAGEGSLSPAVPGDSRAQMQAEAARISIVNASSQPGLAENLAQYLTSQGANVVQTSNAEQVTSRTTLTDYAGSPYALKYLTGLVPEIKLNLISQYIANNPIDLEIILGDDWARFAPAP